MSNKIKVLASVYACNPELGSEDGCGWNYVVQLSRFAEVWAVTLPENQVAIEKALKQTPLENVHWVYYDLPEWMRKWHVQRRFERIHYNLWQYAMYQNLAKKLHKEINFDVTHHLTWGQYWSASYLSLLPTKFIWGPVGGGESAPKAFYSTFRKRGLRYELLRDLIRSASHFHPFVRKQAQNATIALATTEDTARKMRELGASNISILPNVGISNEDFKHLDSIPTPKHSPFRFVSIGRLLDLKGFHLGLRAFARLLVTIPDAQYWIIGDGPDEGHLKDICHELGIMNSVTFWGRIPRNEALSRIGECNVVVHPSLHDSSGWVPLEAGGAGRPVICLKIGGPALLVTDETGIRIEAHNPEQAIQDIAKAMIELAENPEMCEKKGQAAKQRVKDEFLWDCVGDYFSKLSIYQTER